MSRSKRKAIYKDKGNVNNYYWKVHRRVNKASLNHLIKSNFTVKYVYNGEKWLDEEELKKINESDYIAWEVYTWNHKECYDFYMSNLKLDDIGDFDSWYKSPKELINDYDYCDYIIDEENDWATSSHNLNVEHREDRKETLSKMRRK